MVMDEAAGRQTIIALFRRTAQAMISDLVERIHVAGFEEMTEGLHPLFENVDAEGTRLTVLAARAEMTHQSMSELIQAASARGLVERRPDPSDGRARLVCLTPRGRQMVMRAYREMARIEGEWSAHWAAAGFVGDMRSVLLRALREYKRQPGSA
jgi:DNA-binding MarR family transcriptional regulator